LDIAPAGEIRQLFRYSVKSFAGESLDTVKIETYGLFGDRSHAFIDETKEDWDRYVTARTIPAMLGYRAELAGEEAAADEFPPVRVTAPDGRTMRWDGQLLAELQAHSSAALSMERHSPHSADLLAVDTGSILIVTDTSLHTLESLWGKRLDSRRFRPNLIVSVAEGSHGEHGWIGKRLRIGGAELQVDGYCERCEMITIAPDTQERDASLLRTVNAEMGLNFGVYASVCRTGRIRVGDKVYVVQAE
jgi:hypothetical protein